MDAPIAAVEVYIHSTDRVSYNQQLTRLLETCVIPVQNVLQADIISSDNPTRFLTKLKVFLFGNTSDTSSYSWFIFISKWPLQQSTETIEEEWISGMAWSFVPSALLDEFLCCFEWNHANPYYQLPSMYWLVLPMSCLLALSIADSLPVRPDRLCHGPSRQ